MKFVSLKKQVILGKGLVITIDCPVDLPKSGDMIIIDDIKYKVASIYSSSIESGKVPRVRLCVYEEK